MFFIDLRRVFRIGWLGFKRNSVISIASILVTTITLSVITALILFQAFLSNTLQEFQNRVDITVYFTTDAPEDQMLAFKDSVASLPEVKYAAYVSADEALENFRARHANDYVTLQALDELNGNPLGAYVVIKAHDTAQYEAIARTVGGDGALAEENALIIDKINYSQNKAVIERLNNLMSGSQQLGFAVTLVLVIVSVLITFNTIRLTIYMSREEIGVMRLVGASTRYIRGPFMVAGILYGVVASFLALTLFFPITYWMSDMRSFLQIDIFQHYTTHFLSIFLIVVGSGIILGIISSMFAIRKYLKT